MKKGLLVLSFLVVTGCIGNRSGEQVPGEAIIGFKGSSPCSGIQKLSYDPSETFANFKIRMQSEYGNKVLVEPNLVFSTRETVLSDNSNPTSEISALAQINSMQSTTETTIKVAVVDSGVDISHIYLKPWIYQNPGERSPTTELMTTAMAI